MHGRTVKENKTAVAAPSFDAIGAIVGAVTIPVIANGGLEHPSDIQKILSATGAAGVMSSEALLENPALFYSTSSHAGGGGASDEEVEAAIVMSAMMSRQLSLAFEYLSLAAVHYPVFYGGSGGINCVMSHVFKILYRVLDLKIFHSHRARLAGMGKQNSTVSDVVELLHEVSALFETKQDEICGGEGGVGGTSWYRRHRKRDSENSSGSGSGGSRRADIRLRMQQLKVRKEERRQKQALG